MLSKWLWKSQYGWNQTSPQTTGMSRLILGRLRLLWGSCYSPWHIPFNSFELCEINNLTCPLSLFSLKESSCNWTKMWELSGFVFGSSSTASWGLLAFTKFHRVSSVTLCILRDVFKDQGKTWSPSKLCIPVEGPSSCISRNLIARQ